MSRRLNGTVPGAQSGPAHQRLDVKVLSWKQTAGLRCGPGAAPPRRAGCAAAAMRRQAGAPGAYRPP
jgi:hypothetical protein